MPTDKLIPSIDRRLSAWINVQQRLSEPVRATPRPTITISRLFGCEAYPLAERLQQALERRTGEPWTIFDKALIERVSRESGLSERLLRNLGDESRVLDKLAAAIPGWRTHAEAYEVLIRHIVRIAKEGNAIIVGQGGAVVTQDLPACYHFRLEAPLEDRIASIRQRLALDQDAAAALVAEQQARRDRFLEQFLHCSLSDPRLHHAVFNTSRSPLERIVESILALLPFAAVR